ncbi:unnamed protein product [Blumeria hordei]|uniref:Thioredoxin domain-containing protein n=1 Tax=Blumeria hordei TaxID=2867405 RepID=A0A383V162_BLUHO|nr:unnamed protein product [Blumeria hordei]
MVVHRISSVDEYHKLIKSHENVVLLFASDWSGTRDTVTPVFEKLSDEIKDVHFVSVNGKDSSALCAELYVLAMPAYVAVKNGEKVDQLMGVFPYEMRHSMTNFGYKMIEDKLVKR